MKIPHLSALSVAALFLAVSTTEAALSIPSDGSDGSFNPTSSVVIDLSQATSGQWDVNNSANTGKGIYDSNKWAVVFKYSSVNIPAGVAVTFKNHPSYAPVVWLVQGNITIAGTVSVAGQRAATSDPILGLTPAEPGPGGFRGAANGPSGRGSGYGPGGAAPGGFTTGHGAYASAYGNPQIIPLIGGSGGGSYYYGNINGPNTAAGAGAGGAILIAAGLSATISGTIDARGGGPFDSSSTGSGGAIRLIAEQVLGKR